MPQQLLVITFFSLAALPKTYAATVYTSDLLISEVMANPAAVSDANGEWFEIFNASTHIVDLNGLTISDNGSNSHTIDANGSLSVLPGNYFVLANNADATSNGGFVPDYVYNGFSLANSDDQIIIRRDSIEITRLEYSGSPFGIAGFSAELLNQVVNPQPDDYGITPINVIFRYGEGDFGTPGAAGSTALSVDAPVPHQNTFWLFGSGLLLFMRKYVAS